MWFAGGKKVRDTDYGKTLGELGIKNQDIITVKKNSVDADTEPNCTLVDQEGKLCERAANLFSEWYDKYSSKEGAMTLASTTRFILGATNESISAEDGRIKSLFDGYDQDKDGVLQRHEFIEFYRVAARDKADRVFDNIKNHFIRGDLTKFSEISEELLFTADQMPRHTLSHHQAQFDTIMNLLDRDDGTSDEVWGLIRMLETNQKIYQQILSMQIDNSEVKLETSPEEFWKQFFASGSIYRQSYTQEIIEALMSDGSDLTNRVFFVSFQNQVDHHNDAVLPKVKQREVNLDN